MSLALAPPPRGLSDLPPLGGGASNQDDGNPNQDKGD